MRTKFFAGSPPARNPKTNDRRPRIEGQSRRTPGGRPGPDFFGKAEQYARRKLDLCNERAGRQYGEDGYGDEYLVLLTADTVREMAFSEYTMIRSAEIMAEAAAGGKAVEA